jgi:hypothetical protein
MTRRVGRSDMRASRGGPPQDTDLSRAMGIPESESVESGAKDDDLPNPSFDSS